MRARGFTLIELIVAVLVSAIVVAAAVTLLAGTQRAFQGGVDDRAMQETARAAMDEITTSLSMAGYGLDPTFVFDFGQMNSFQYCTPPGQQSTVRFGGYQCANPVTCRDSITGPDEIVFYSRDPLFEHDLAGAVGVNSLTLSGPIDPSLLQQGQILQIMCYGTNDQWLWAYVEVQSVSNANTASVQVTLQPSAGNPADFPTQQGAFFGQACFASGTRRAYKIDRYRYYVAAIDPTGAVQAWETAGTRPYLMLDQGLPTSPQAIAPDVEDLQVAYAFPSDPTAGPVLQGATQGLALTNSQTGIDLTSTPPTFTTPVLDPARTTYSPANIQAVRVALIVRRERSDPNCVDQVCTQLPASLNRPAVAGQAGYQRQVYDTTVYIPNMKAQLPVFPYYDPSYTTGNCQDALGNCGGG